MLFIVLGFVLVAVPMGIYYWREYKISTPRIQWPVLAPLLKLEYLPDPPGCRARATAAK